MRFDQPKHRQLRSAPGYRRLITLAIVAGVALIVALVVNLRDSRPPPGLPANPQIQIGIVEPSAADDAPNPAADRLPGAPEPGPVPAPMMDPAPEQPLAAPEPLEGDVDLSRIPAVSREVSEEGLVALFQQMRNDSSWLSAPLPIAPANAPSLRTRLIATPEKYRGEIVSVEGQLVSFDRHVLPLSLEPLPVGNPSGVDRYFEAFVFDHTHRMFFLVAVWRHTETLFADGDIVSMRGRFLQNYVYDVNRDGRNEPWGIPVIVGESLTRQVPRATPLSPSSPLFVSLGVVVALFVGVVVAAGVISRRGDRRFKQKMEELRGKRREPTGRDGSPGRPQEDGP